MKKSASDIEKAKAEIEQKTMKLKEAEEAHNAYVTRKSQSSAVVQTSFTVDDGEDEIFTDQLMSQIEEAEASQKAATTKSSILPESSDGE